MTTPLVLPPLEVEICGAKANIYYFDWLKCLTALPRVFMTFVNPLPYWKIDAASRMPASGFRHLCGSATIRIGIEAKTLNLSLYRELNVPIES
jgi:hypothetical protein